MRISDWSSDVCSSDLLGFELPFEIGTGSTLGKQRLLNFVRRTVKCKMPTPVVACSGTEELGRWRYARDHRIRYRQLLDPVGMIGCHGKTDPHADIVPRHAKSLVAKGIHHRDQFVTDRRDIVIAARVVGSDDVRSPGSARINRDHGKTLG